MHIRISRVKRDGKTYEYAQLVQSFRRESDGMPTQRVVETLGPPGSVEVENMRAALAAAKAGKRVVVASAPRRAGRSKPKANLRYLDLAVLLELWRGWGLDEILNALLPMGDAEMSPAAVIAALTLQRCVDPGSKLYASRWLPRTALPELLALSPKSFNNTRLHRVLDGLDEVTGDLMRKLPRLYAEREGAFAALFLDVTDAWFVGHGPSMAERAKTKEGLVQRKIGIVLLCNEHGLPLRWEVIPGARNDSISMTDMLRSIAGLSWVGDAPIVCDRAMGKTAQIRDMIATGLRFLTALTITEFNSYSDAIPHAAFADFKLDVDEAQNIAEATRRAANSGLAKESDNLFVLDLGTIERREGEDRQPDPEVSPKDRVMEAMRLCREIKDGVADERYGSLGAAGRALGLRKGVMGKYLQLDGLSQDIQRAILDGQVAGHALAPIIEIARIEDSDAQRDAFAPLIATQPKLKRRPQRRASKSSPEQRVPIRVRAVVYFNPERFVEQRVRAQKHLDEIQSFVAELNANLAAPRSRRDRDSIVSAIDRKLRSYDLLDAYQVAIDEQQLAGRTRYSVRLLLDAAKWARRRRYDGFCFLIAHPEVPQTPAELCNMYRAKDVVEKDFETIKSVAELRPVRHHTDGKVRAHVTLCMLALLLERTLQRRLTNQYTPREVIELLSTCNLNRYASGEADGSAYAVTEADDDQNAILRALRMQHLADDDEMMERITPR